MPWLSGWYNPGVCWIAHLLLARLRKELSLEGKKAFLKYLPYLKGTYFLSVKGCMSLMAAEESMG